MAQHTERPWTIEDEPYEGNPDFVAISGKGWGALATVVVMIDGEPSAEGRANANLINAAPELLAALQICKDALQDHVQYDDGKSLERDGFDAASIVIAKATKED